MGATKLTPDNINETITGYSKCSSIGTRFMFETIQNEDNRNFYIHYDEKCDSIKTLHCTRSYM